MDFLAPGCHPQNKVSLSPNFLQSITYYVPDIRNNVPMWSGWLLALDNTTPSIAMRPCFSIWKSLFERDLYSVMKTKEMFPTKTLSLLQGEKVGAQTESFGGLDQSLCESC